MVTYFSQKTPKYSCELCNFISFNKKDFDRHIETIKHKKLGNDNIMITCDNIVLPLKKCHCECGKQYKFYSGLSRHKKICSGIKEKEKELVAITETSSKLMNTEIIMELLKQNNDFKILISEQNKHTSEQNKNMLTLIEKGIGNTTNTNSHNTTNKNKFNLNIFLNEQCKDAMNIMDFVDSLELQLTDLERVGQLGYVKGISNIVVKALQKLDVFKRPIHCSDVKRETMYVKDHNAWEKENEKNEKITKMIKQVAHKNVKQLSEWQEENPKYKDGESDVHEQFLKIVNESMGGYNEEEDSKNYNKIIHAVAKEVIIEREKENDAEPFPE